MRAKMSSESGFLSSTITTQFTWIWFFSGMRAKMNGEMAFLSSTIFTKLTFERFVT